MAVFKTLERYGHFLRNKHSVGLRRHIRFDDMNMSLVMDFALPKEDTWSRVDYENAREELRNAPSMGSFSGTPFSSSSAADVSEPAPAASRTWGAPPTSGGQERQDEQQGAEEWGSQAEEMDQANQA